MQFELNILEKSLESEFTHQNRTVPLFRGLLLAFIIIFIIPKSDTEPLFVLRILLLFLGIIYYIFSDTEKRTEIDIKDYFIGRLKSSSNGFTLEKQNGLVAINEDFQGQLVFRYEGYHKEVIGYSRNRNIYYGKNNTITISSKGEEKVFYIFLKNKYDRRHFFELIDWTYHEKLDFKEFTRGKRTYLGKGLNFSEIQSLKNNT